MLFFVRCSLYIKQFVNFLNKKYFLSAKFLPLQLHILSGVIHFVKSFLVMQYINYSNENLQMPHSFI